MVKMIRALMALALGMSLVAWRHPVHAARVELIATGSNVTVTVRAYRDDFPPGTARVAVSEYLNRTLKVTDDHGAVVSLLTVSISLEGDRVCIVLRGTVTGKLSKGHLAVTIMQEKFTDQVNVVSATIDGKKLQMVFLSRDGAQVLD